MTIYFYAKQVFGNTNLYPFGKFAEIINKITNQKTITPQQIALFKTLKITFKKIITPK